MPGWFWVDRGGAAAGSESQDLSRPQDPGGQWVVPSLASLATSSGNIVHSASATLQSLQ